LSLEARRWPRPDLWGEDASKQAGQPKSIKGWQVSSAGYTAAWATGNTRAELWDAMKRKEAYATSGTRMVARSSTAS
jgi:hypothetical protein